jgi:hypothetical protein
VRVGGEGGHGGLSLLLFVVSETDAGLSGSVEERGFGVGGQF